MGGVCGLELVDTGISLLQTHIENGDLISKPEACVVWTGLDLLIELSDCLIGDVHGVAFILWGMKRLRSASGWPLVVSRFVRSLIAERMDPGPGGSIGGKKIFNVRPTL